MDKSEYLNFAKNILKINFKDINLLMTAFTHRSFLNEHRNTVKVHNERLEFLGDAVLELVVTEFLYTNYNQPEGVLTNLRSCLVRTESLIESALTLNIEPLLLLSKGEKRGSLRARQQIMANCFEAIIGAIYLDQGYNEAKTFIDKYIITKLGQILKDGNWLDPKSKLQEVVQREEAITPSYKVIEEQGPDHDKSFKVGVFLKDHQIGVGSGTSKHIAQQNAAKNALGKYSNKNIELT